MNIRIELLNLQLKSDKLDAAEFAAKFSLIAEEYNRLQNLQQTDCSKLREIVVQRLNSITSARAASNKLCRNAANTQRKVYEGFIKLIDELSPVA